MSIKRLFTTLLLTLTVWCVSAIERSTSIVYINGTKYYIHTVQQGETLYAISKGYEVSTELIEQHNPSVKAGLRAGAKIKIPVENAPTAEVSKKKQKKTLPHTMSCVARRSMPLPANMRFPSRQS